MIPLIRRTVVATVVFFPAFMLPSHAEPYMGLALGQATWTEGCDGTVQCERHDTAGSVRAGYRFNPYVSLEARYLDLGKLDRVLQFETQVPGNEGIVTIAGAAESYRVRGAGIGAVATWPLTEAFSLGATAGIARLRTTRTFTSSLDGIVGSDDRRISSSRPYYGLRATYAWSRESDAGLEAERYDVNVGGGNTPVDAIGVVVTYRFR